MIEIWKNDTVLQKQLKKMLDIITWFCLDGVPY